MQRLCKFEALYCIGQKFNVNVIKTAHIRSNFLKTLVSIEIFTSIGLRKKICFKIPRIFNLENVISIFIKNLVNVAMRLELGCILQHFYVQGVTAKSADLY